MEHLLVSLLNTAAGGADALETPLGAARWWAGLALPAVPGKPRFDAALAATLQALRAAARQAAGGMPAAVPLPFRGDASDAILFEVAHAIRVAAGDGTLGRIRLCAERTCARYFFDETKNGSRRWCSLRCMERARAPRRRTIVR